MNRRDFLKLVSWLPIGLSAPHVLQTFGPFSAAQGQPKNVIVIILDAFSAHDISLYGYARRTTPNIDRLASRAVVYHNHFSGGNFTSPGTASLLTGVLPWTNRALNLNGKVIQPYVDKNIFSAFQDYYRIAYTHNGYANTFLKQFQGHLDEWIPRESLYLESYDSFISTVFSNDDDIASISWVRSMKVEEEGSAYSLFLSHLYEWLQDRKIEKLKPLFPRGLPTVSSIDPYLLETAVDAIKKRLTEIPQPFMGYFHFMPPHHPYRTSHEFFNAFKGDGFKPIEKPIDILARRVVKELPRQRAEYDEFILYADREFARLYSYLESSGLLENTWLVLTSDHGEMFERGISGHGSKVLYQPVVRVPLMIFAPGQQSRQDIYEHTSAIDLLPTLASLCGTKKVDWTEGSILPPFSSPNADRSIFAVQAIDNSPQKPLTQASVILIKNDYKLHYYFGYPELPGGETVKLFNIKSDPEELVDLYLSKNKVAEELLHELKIKLKQVNEPFSV